MVTRKLDIIKYVYFHVAYDFQKMKFQNSQNDTFFEKIGI